MTEVLLKELTTSDIDWMIATGHQREIAPGTILIQEGKATDFLHILLDGILTVSISQPDNNPLTRAFAAIEGDEVFSREIARLSSGEVVGELPFVGNRLTATTVKAVEKSLVMSISQQKLAAKLQQDVGFASRFYRAIAIILSDRIQSTINQQGRNNLAQSQPLRDVLFVLGGLHDSDIDWMTNCGKMQKILANTVLIRESGLVDGLYILLDGAMSLSIDENERNPLARAFAAIEGSEISGREIARLSKGEIIGETPFIDGRLPLATVKAIEDSIVLSIERQQLAAKLQQDIGFASRFYQVIATLLSQRLQGMLSQLGYGRRVYSKGLPLAKDVQYEDELNDNVLDRVALAGKRFDWMLGRLKVS
ncbi:cyclic nucleotide-binding domain-containing protein [Nostoc muscorum FACHB-395]|jgi:bacteriocin-type transport-associated protein|uniref:cyclic nucleotide-binding domain-containing protein n=1 Tax=Nostoc sp. C057 TaxID=2576903 RepID=UPI0015C36259|nr:cyclic nucleotide-binding domain-containing protein [Nostoc sp. C057]MBD2511522.1 cyclic nucleotide-binding domain-containing protein [Desmonostoc muscorum FACHB-395]QLE53216.1 cyclic nucleotide-binding domain-containing protein [Nostoc sp. C057]